MAEPDTAYGAMADIYDKAAGRAFRAGDFDKSLLFIAVARDMDPSRADLWAQREFRVKTAETQRYPLAELRSRRLLRLSHGLEDPAVWQWVEHNRSLQLRNGIEDQEAEL